jgi:uncharacterized protein YjbI with pentapeptide repeats
MNVNIFKNRKFLSVIILILFLAVVIIRESYVFYDRYAYSKLMQGSKAWNEFNSGYNKKINLKGIKLYYEKFEGYEFTNVNFANIECYQCEFKDVKFTNVNFLNSYLQNTEILSSTITTSILNKTFSPGVTIEGNIIFDSEIIGNNFDSGFFSNNTFSNTIIYRNNFHNTIFTYNSFSRVYLQKEYREEIVFLGNKIYNEVRNIQGFRK